MRIGVPKEVKNNENRVGLTPAGVMQLTQHQHKVVIEKAAGVNSGFIDELYIEAGAVIAETASEVWKSEMVIKVKEPTPDEYKYFYDGLILFTYLHLAADRRLTEALIEKNVVAVAYETVQLPNRTLPLLTPMSEVAGRMATQIGAAFLEKTHGGKGVLLGGVPGVNRGKVTIIGGGVVGTNAAKVAVGLGAQVSILDVSPERLRELDDIFGYSITTLMSSPYTIADTVAESDLVIGAVLIPGAKAPKLVTEEMVCLMQEGSVIVDVAIDQGGIFETATHVTTHANPTYVKHGVVHYAVGNMPGAVPRTSTIALTNVTVPYILQIANKGYERAFIENDALHKGLNVLNGKIVYEEVAKAHQMTMI
ncbi:alanine dehydrogenase [Bacillus sp. 17376]|uniref:Alanine dehydrogenase n=1 Tax=Mesobacillus boroniphilus JCM 21738 TaxID=1294265 RepID=W4RMK6_9BACI|nr:alanine dehydrogenase [Mesobacillus boroniphilus]ESU33957.1 alanine dehydrogenase [Bacillus sp. 17376]GAE45660.1 alanine dehydrogenase [Mesobacillus boroniphilus JCM 21738]